MAPRDGKPVLPVPGERNILVTSALPYVNNVPHLGNVVGSVLSADVFARFSRARGNNTLFICGTDEYGTATETKAIEEKLTPQQLCDKYYRIHKDVYDWFNIVFDEFGRTPTKQQTDIAQDIFLKLQKHGYLEERTTIQPYCETHKSFLADRFVEGTCPLCGFADARGDQCDSCGKLLDPFDLGNPKCKLDGASPVPRETKHIYILLDKLQPMIKTWWEKSAAVGKWSENGIEITRSWVDGVGERGLKPRGITRDLKWGTAVPLPGYEDKVLYVWFDACIGYVSMTATYTEDWEKWWRNPEDVQLYQFMGKDNVPFHTVIFPGSQLGGGDVWTKLHHLSTTEYLNYEKGKFSKSRGIGVFGTNAKDTGVPPDVWRFYLLSHRPENSDSEFEWKEFISSNNNILVKDLGNFVNRIVKFVNSKNYDSVIPDYTKHKEPILDECIADVNAILKQYIDELERVKIKTALETALKISSRGNKLLQENKLDNALAAEQPEKCAAVVGVALNLVYLLAAVFQPYMPETSASMLQQLNIADKADALHPVNIPDAFDPTVLKPGHKIGKASYLFSNIKPEKEEDWRRQFGGSEAQRALQEKAEKKAAKKAAAIKRKGPKAGEKGKDKDGTVEGDEKDGAQHLGEAPNGVDGVDAVTDGVHRAALQPS